jgi:hypothetical protein
MSPPPGELGNVVLEATEFTVWGTDDQNEALNAARTIGYFGVSGTGNAPNNLWARGRLVKVLAEGFKNYNGLSPFATRVDGSTPSPQEGEDFATMWEFRDASGNPVAVKFVAVYANRTRDARFFVPDADGNIPGILAQSGDAEIDAVGYIPFTPPPAVASISGRVINDANGNGAIDAGEAPIPGVTVTLFDATGTNSVAVATTDANGSYSFANLVPASYRVVETNLPNYIDTGVLPGAGNTAVNLNTIAATLVGGQNSAENNFLDALPPVDCVPACYLDVDMWTINFAARQTAYARAGGIGNIFLLSLNRGAASDDEVIAVFESFGGGRIALEREFIAAQLNAANYPGSVFNRATCFYLGPNVPLKLPGNPRLIDVLNEARAVYATGTDLQIRTVTFQLATFNNITATAGIVCQFADP